MARKPHSVAHIIRWLSRPDAKIEVRGLQPSTYKGIKDDALMYLQCWQRAEGWKIASEVADAGVEIANLRMTVEMLRSDLDVSERALTRANSKIADLEGGENVTEYVFWKPSGNDYDFLKCVKCGQDLAEPVLEKWDWCPKCGRLIAKKAGE